MLGSPLVMPHVRYRTRTPPASRNRSRTEAGRGCPRTVASAAVTLGPSVIVPGAKAGCEMSFPVRAGGGRRRLLKGQPFHEVLARRRTRDANLVDSAGRD